MLFRSDGWRVSLSHRVIVSTTGAGDSRYANSPRRGLREGEHGIRNIQAGAQVNPDLCRTSGVTSGVTSHTVPQGLC